MIFLSLLVHNIENLKLLSMKKSMAILFYFLVSFQLVMGQTQCLSGNCENGNGIQTYEGGGRYEGNFKEGLRNGLGNYIWSNGDKYSGEWKEGKLTGYGTYTFISGIVQTGYWENSVFLGASPKDETAKNESTGCISGNCENGYGVKTYSKGGRYEGNFKNSFREGEGNYIWASGDKYSGYWVAGDYTGYGTYTYSNGIVQSGYWYKNEFIGAEPNSSLTGCVSGNCQDGNGICIYDKGRYEGNFNGGFRNGQGTYYWKEGDKYIGEWTEGHLTGMGTYYFNSGTSKFGYWENSNYIGLSKPGQSNSTGCISGNCKDGNGIYVFDNGDRYEGSFKSNLQEGYGIYNWSTGIKYEGIWAAGQQNGEGKVTYKDGYIQTGYWSSGKFSGEKQAYTDKCISGDCDNGYGINTWQSGEKYEGYWKNLRRNGQGTNYYSNGDVYTGNWKDDKQDGYGSLKFHNGSNYDGDWKMHKEEGVGTFTYSNGEKYIGEWKEGKFSGQGTYYYSDGSSKSGIWENDIYKGKTTNSSNLTIGCISGNCSNGYGTYVWEKGEKYEGYWIDGKRNGQGTNYFIDGAVYTGEWKDDSKQGSGTYKYSSGNKDDYYTGHWQNDKINGRGILVFKDGHKYEGSFHDYYFDGEGTTYNIDGTVQSGIWKDGVYIGKSKDNYGCISGECSNGFGTYTFESGEKYVGNFINGEYSGQGSYYYSSGDKYSGEFKNSKRDGQGTYTFSADGRKYVGEWKDNKYDGYGTMYYSNGTKKEGSWKANEFITERSVASKPPVINWLSPEFFTTTSANPTITIKLCIKSSSALVNLGISNNGKLVSDKIIADNAPKGSDCDYSLEKTINLKEGENQLKVLVDNANGSTSSELRTISYRPNSNSSGNKFALVIGNSDYTVSTLKNPVNDASGIARALKSLGFDVMLYTNSSQAEMLKSIRSFGEKLAAGKGIGLFYFAGHGIQMNGNNYIIPVDAKIEKEQDVELEAVNLMRVMGELDYAQNETNIVILDACRNNPFARSFRSGGNNGLATVLAPQGTIIAYATAPGSVASDGSGENGLYTQELLTALKVPGLKIEDMFKRVRSNVYEKSYKQQVPWENSSLFVDFYFNK
jgi:hypothetical protein